MRRYLLGLVTAASLSLSAYAQVDELTIMAPASPGGGSPELFEAECRTPRQIQLANAFCRYLEIARPATFRL
jgi:hypothetical protein